MTGDAGESLRSRKRSHERSLALTSRHTDSAPDARCPAVSVILCTYNRRGLVGRAIRSVLAQTFAAFELVVIDDGSTDGTAEVVLAFAARDARIIYERHANRGLAAARNAGLALARGKWVTFLDSDDAYAPDHLAARIALVAARPVDALFGGVRFVGRRPLRYVADVERPGHKIHLAHCHIGGALFVRRAVLVRLGGFPALPYAEDHELMKRIEEGYRVARCVRRSYLYNLRGGDRMGIQYLERQRSRRAGQHALLARRAA